jgi:Pyridoxamine 5'-phosphate oxidase
MDEFLARPLFAHLATASPDGPRESPVWFLWEDGALWIIASRVDDSFPARIERAARCAIGIVDFDRCTGKANHIGFRGRRRYAPLIRSGPGAWSPDTLALKNGSGTAAFAAR